MTSYKPPKSTDDDDDDDGASSDSTGFPGYQEGLDIFTSWADAMKSNADSWNTLWNRVKNGKARSKHWSHTVASSIETFSTLSQQIWRTLSGPSAPPWVNLPFPPKSTVELQISKVLSVDFPIQPVSLAFLDKDQQSSLNVQVSAVSRSRISLFVNDDDWETFEPQVGQYIGLIFSDEYADPIAVISFRVTDANIKKATTAFRDSRIAQGIATGDLSKLTKPE